jgi:hypothetical protein
MGIKRGKGVNHLNKFKKWTSAIGDVAKSVADYIAPVSKPLLNAGVNMALEKMGQPSGIDIYAKSPEQVYATPIAQPTYVTPIAQPTYATPIAQPTYAQEHFNLPPLPDNYAIPYGKSYASGMKRGRPRKGGSFLSDLSKFGHQISPYVKMAYPESAVPLTMLGYGRKPKAPRAKRVMTEAQKNALAKGRAKLRHTLNEKYARGEIGDGMKKRGSALMPAGYGFDKC